MEDIYEIDIIENWVDTSLGINYLDACQMKDETSLSASEAKKMVLSYRKNGGKGSAVNYVIKRFEYENDTNVVDEFFYPKKEMPYMVRDFV